MHTSSGCVPNVGTRSIPRDTVFAYHHNGVIVGRDGDTILQSIRERGWDERECVVFHVGQLTDGCEENEPVPDIKAMFGREAMSTRECVDKEIVPFTATSKNNAATYADWCTRVAAGWCVEGATKEDLWGKPVLVCKGEVLSSYKMQHPDGTCAQYAFSVYDAQYIAQGLGLEWSECSLFQVGQYASILQEPYTGPVHRRYIRAIAN
jgi:hypothetical protein